VREGGKEGWPQKRNTPHDKGGREGREGGRGREAYPSDTDALPVRGFLHCFVVGVDGLKVSKGEGGREDEDLSGLGELFGRHAGPAFAVHHELEGREGGRKGGRVGGREGGRKRGVGQ